jgi:hypothetical protein
MNLTSGMSAAEEAAAPGASVAVESAVPGRELSAVCGRLGGSGNTMSLGVALKNSFALCSH